MNQLEYLDENSLRSYPLKDGAFLHWSYSGGGTVPDNFDQVLPAAILLDLTLNVIDTSVLSNPVLNFTGLTTDLTTFTFKFTWLGHNYSVAATGLDTREFFVDVPGQVQLEVTIDMDALKDYFETLPAGDYTLDMPAQVCIGCIKLQPWMVEQIEADNTIYTGIPAVNSIGSENIIELNSINDGWMPFRIQQGANFNFTDNVTGPMLDISPGAGTGLYDNCSTGDPKIYTINNVRADGRGNISLNNDGCWSTTPDINAIRIKNTCLPSTSSEDVLSFAHYLNRMLVRDAELATLAIITNANYTSMINAYEACREIKLGTQSPYLIAQSSEQSNKVSRFHSVTCGVYCPGNTTIPITLSTSYSIGSQVSNYTLVPDSCYVIQDSIKSYLSSPVIADSRLTLIETRNMTPNSVAYAGYVLQQPVSPVLNTGLQVYDAVFYLTTPDKTYSAGCSLPLAPATANFEVSYRFKSGGSADILEVDVALTDPANNSVPTSLIVYIPGFYTVTSSTLVINQQTPINLGKTTGFSYTSLDNTPIDFSKSNSYRLTAHANASNSTPFSISVQLKTADNLSANPVVPGASVNKILTVYA